MAKTIKYLVNGTTLTKVSADPVSPVESELQYSDGTARAAGVWQFKGGSWIALSDVTVSLLELKDTPETYTGQAGKILKVNIGEDGLELADESGGVATFPELTDTPANYTSHANKLVAVTVGEDGLEFVTPPSTDFQSLTDTPGTYTAQGLKTVRVNAGETGLEFVDPVVDTDTDNFEALTDTPASYTGEANKVVTVKATEDGLEFTTPAAGGAFLEDINSQTEESAISATLDFIPYWDSSVGAVRKIQPNDLPTPASTSLALQDGLVSAPSLHFANSTNTGMYATAPGRFEFAAAGVKKLDCTVSRIEFNVPLRHDNGLVSACSYAFKGMLDGGLYRDSGSDSLRMAINGSDSMRWLSSKNIVQGATNAATADADLFNNSISFYLDETGNTLTVKAKYSGGTVKTGTIALA